MAGISEQFESLEEQLALRVARAAEHLASEIRSNLPRRRKGKSRNTATGVRVVHDTPLRATVVVPWPWKYNEFGTGKQPPNPVVRRALAAQADRLIAILEGED
jgi:HK97 gp10 family phage protein